MRKRNKDLIIIYNNKSKTLREWAECLGMKYSTLYNRIYTYKHSIEKAFNEKVIEKHGHSGRSPEYNAWSDMKARCLNPTHKWFHRYGGRGITICEQWADSFQDFLSDMGLRPGKGFSLDRINNNGNYEPENCRWASQKDQTRNNSRNRLVEYNGKTYCMSELQEKFNLPRNTIEDRINKGIPVDEAIETPIRKHEILLTYNGVTQNLNQWSKELGVSISCLSLRLRKNLPVKEIIETPSLKKKILFNGEEKTAKEWAEIYGITVDTLRKRLNSGCDIGDALTWPRWKKRT